MHGRFDILGLELKKVWMHKIPKAPKFYMESCSCCPWNHLETVTYKDCPFLPDDSISIRTCSIFQRLTSKFEKILGQVPGPIKIVNILLTLK